MSTRVCDIPFTEFLRMITRQNKPRKDIREITARGSERGDEKMHRVLAKSLPGNFTEIAVPVMSITAREPYLEEFFNALEKLSVLDVFILICSHSEDSRHENSI